MCDAKIRLTSAIEKQITTLFRTHESEIINFCDKKVTHLSFSG